MSWLYSQALGEAFLEENSWDGEQCAQLNVMPTPHKFWRNDRTMEFCDLSRFGLTLQLLTESHGEALLTWYLEGFHAKTLAQPGKAQESQAQDQECGKKWHGLLAKYDPVSCLWKTAQCSLLEDLELSLETWPRWGSMRNGACYLRPMLVPTTKGKESGLWATPKTMDKLPPKSPEALLKEATFARPGRSKPANLRDQVSNMKNWPTPKSKEPGMSAKTSGRHYTKSTHLTTQVAIAEGMINPETGKKWPTPTASASKGSSSASLVRKNGKSRVNDRLDHSVMASNGGQLNPTWVEWLMGWLLGWTDLKPLVTDKYHSAQQQHSNYSEND